MRRSEIQAELRRRLPEIVPVENVRWDSPAGDRNGVHRPSAEVRLRGRRLRLLFEIEAQPNMARLREAVARIRSERNEGKGRRPVLVAPYLNREMRQLCRNLGQAYVDLSGNAWLDHGSILIDREVAKNLYPHEARKRSPFADRASLVLRYLLEKPAHQGGVREIARAAGLSPGYVSKVVDGLIDLGYGRRLSEGQVELRNLRELLADWSALYSWKKNRLEGYYCRLEHVDDVYEALRKDAAAGRADFALSLHMGNNLVEPFAAYSVGHIYVRDRAPIDRLKKMLKLAPADVEGANLVFLWPYYRDSVFYGARQVKGVRVVSDLQLYLDLRRYPVRGEEAAQSIFRRRLAPAWRIKPEEP